MTSKTTDSRKALQQKFVQLIEQNQGIIYKVAHAYCKDPEDQKDLAQEIILQLWKSFENYSPEFKFSTWMYRICLNVSISHLRKKKVRDKHQASQDFRRAIIHRESSEPMEQEIKCLQQFVQQQKEIDKALLLLFLDGNSYAEIASILDVSTSNVGTKMSRLKEKLKTYLKTCN